LHRSRPLVEAIADALGGVAAGDPRRWVDAAQRFAVVVPATEAGPVLARFEELLGVRMRTEYVDEPRRGDHICYITNLRRFRTDYPEWEVTVDLDAVFASFRRHGSDIAKGPLRRALPQPR